MRPQRLLAGLCLLVLAAGNAPAAEAQQPPASQSAGPLARASRVLYGPPPPVPPAVINRDAEGRATVRAVRVDGLVIDGVLDDQAYRQVPAIDGFIMQEPVEGPPATEKTEIWLLFDDDNFYISVRCWNSAPESEWVVQDMRRDSFNVTSGEYVGVLLDTFYDRRNGFNMGINPIGGRIDSEMTNEREFNMDWNPIWELRTGRFDGGWTIEAALPFKSLRYRPGREQIWGFNVMRNVHWKNERSFLNPMPAARGQGAVSQASLAATIVGIEAPAERLRAEIKPYAIADLTTDQRGAKPFSNELGGTAGIDAKYAVTQNLVADVTVNTDFAQVEADEQQVNLTRFSLFFPEKREFFLENQGTFTFGGAAAHAFGGGGAGDTPVLFYSRRIGLADVGGIAREVPLDAGARMTGRVGRFRVGLLNIQTGDEPTAAARATNFSVARLSADVLRRSSVGAIYARRSLSVRAPGSNETYGVDGAFGFFDDLNINTYWARTATAGFDDDVSYRAQLDYEGDRYGARVERLAVGTDFNPEVGFLRREDFEQNLAQFRFSPRLPSSRVIRKLSWEGNVDYITDRADVLETRQVYGRFGIELENSDRFQVTYNRNYERLDRPFRVARDVQIAMGGYRFDDIQVAADLGPQWPLSGNITVQHGGFFDGDRTSIDLRRGRIDLTRQLSVEPGLSLNWIDLPQAAFTTSVVTARTTYTVTPLMFVSALLQYNSALNAVGANIRLRWEYQPGSELFIVYNEQRDTLARRFPELENRALVVKINRLFRF